MFFQGGHHEDLMFSHENDSQSVKDVRNRERQFMQKWIDGKAGIPPSKPSTEITSTTSGIVRPGVHRRVITT